MRNKKAVFLDRDGVINKNLDNDYVKKWDEFEFLSRSKEAISILTDANWDVVVISNQAGVGKGIMSAQAVEEINARMVKQIQDHGGAVKAVYYCPHRSDEDCECRKPKPGMLFRAADEFDVELSSSYLIGDNITDIQAGAQVGCTTILVKTGHGQKSIEKFSQLRVKPCYIVSDLFEAVKLVLAQNTP